MTYEEIIFKLKERYGINLFLAEELFHVYERRGELEHIERKLEEENVQLQSNAGTSRKFNAAETNDR